MGATMYGSKMVFWNREFKYIYMDKEGRRPALEMPARLLLPRVYFKVKMLETLLSMFPRSWRASWKRYGRVY